MDLRKLVTITMLGFSLAAPSFASDQSASSMDEPMSFPYRLFHADGEHQCWSRDFIGYTCTVSHAAIYTDCSWAFLGLKNDNCCSRMYWKGRRLEDGRSIDFKITKCTNWT